jgi:hypothetical protein
MSAGLSSLSSWSVGLCIDVLGGSTLGSRGGTTLMMLNPRLGSDSDASMFEEAKSSILYCLRKKGQHPMANVYTGWKVMMSLFK